ncbi:hypothetical protein AAES_58302 [Amazona aestiva]|uniref:Uncharacterized protein n=1 Tax=Amazona aestiva TaxID=12930 RepID=A0A0Q3U5U5_AMAAE|nr:hypothetical protein AAES_58302 [Amazona aestiva]
MQPQKKSTFVLLVAELSPCGGEDAKGCLHQVLKPLLPRKVLKRRRHRILQLRAPACQSWLFQHLQELEEEAASRTQVGLQVEPMEVDMVKEEEEATGVE